MRLVVGSIVGVLADHPTLDALVPAMGYGPAQVAELASTLEATPADAVLSATPIDLSRVMRLTKPIVRVRYDLAELDPSALREGVEAAVGRAGTDRTQAAFAGVRTSRRPTRRSGAGMDQIVSFAMASACAVQPMS